jgi:Protein of unknown function (DUF664)
MEPGDGLDVCAAGREEIAFARSSPRDHNVDFIVLTLRGEPLSLRNLLVHMIEEYVHHNGHTRPAPRAHRRTRRPIAPGEPQRLGAASPLMPGKCLARLRLSTSV